MFSYFLQEIISEGLSNGTLLCVSIMYTVKNSFADQTKPQKFNTTKIFHANYFLMWKFPDGETQYVLEAIYPAWEEVMNN